MTEPLEQAEIAVEQQYLDRVYARLAEVREQARAMRDGGYRIAHGAENEARFEQATMLLERDVMVRHATRMLASLDTEHEGLVFGRLDLDDGEPMYIGRLGLRDAQFDNLVTDWRAPAAAAFYQATAADPMGVVRRRVIRCSGERVVDIDDELLSPGETDLQVVGEGALMASMSQARGDAMRDIVATIQREQDEVIRAPAGGITEITGGPGTGKTAVALHRVASLLYRDRRRLGRAGVLVVGPSAAFSRYISRVLPSMGEHDVELRAVGEMLDGVTATRTDPGSVAAVKGSLRMRTVLRRALRATPSGVPAELRIVYSGEVLRLRAGELEAVRREVHRRGGPPNRARVAAAEALLDALWQVAQRHAGEGFRPDRQRLITELGERMDFHRFLVTWWPVLTPEGVLGQLGDRAQLAAAARGVLRREEVAALSASWSAGQNWSQRQQGWSVADIALLDELRVLAGTLRRRRGARRKPQRSGRPENYEEYSHVVLDEAQDLSPMQWRMLGRRGRYASWTIVGDPVQTSWPDPSEADEAKDAALGTAHARRRFTLRTNYRNSAEIFALAARVLRDPVSGDLATPEQLPDAVRSTGVAPMVRTVPSGELADQSRAAVVELLDEVAGTVGVISAMGQAAQLRDWLAGVDDPRLRVMGSLDAKGLEYDAVLLVGPERLIAESVTGRRALYVALSRATQRLTVLATGDSWLPAAE
ncbi:MAG: AAA family ATPase [Pseudonocardiaceae bacterium]|nr:AAA family ATPase [Pseudonocardiaceae bacterium]